MQKGDEWPEMMYKTVLLGLVVSVEVPLHKKSCLKIRQLYDWSLPEKKKQIPGSEKQCGYSSLWRTGNCIQRDKGHCLLLGKCYFARVYCFGQTTSSPELRAVCNGK